jgi:hypothetical protein
MVVCIKSTDRVGRQGEDNGKVMLLVRIYRFFSKKEIRCGVISFLVHPSAVARFKINCVKDPFHLQIWVK